jgi:hypothetical protein
LIRPTTKSENNQNNEQSKQRSTVTMTLSVSTFFHDFALEEVTVAHLTAMGYQLAHRVVGREPWQVGDTFSADLLVTDLASINGDRVIVIPDQARRWGRSEFIDHLHRTLYRNWQDFGHVQERVIVIGSAAVKADGEELVALLQRMQLLDAEESSSAIFHEEDLELAMMPTRRSEEIERIMRIQGASKALFLLKAGRAEISRGESFLEYRRRMHQRLEVGFVLISSRDAESKRFVKEVQSLFHPLPVFSIPAAALSRSPIRSNLMGAKAQSGLRFPRLRIKELAEWLGSTRGDRQ